MKTTHHNVFWMAALLSTTFLMFASCDSKLDIVPKGQVTLGKVSELELLLNQEYMIQSIPAEDLGIVCGETVGLFDQITSVLAQTNTVKYALMTCNEQVDRAVLTTQDSRYNDIYRYINAMNVVINKMDEAQGDERIKPQLISEARVMRAYMHWLAVNIYARQYDPSYAQEVGGIAYNTSTDVMQQKEKLTLEESYQAILDDLTDEILSHLPLKASAHAVRGNLAWGYAVKTMVLFQMKRYAEALPYAQQALQLHPAMFDRSTIRQNKQWVQDQEEANNFIYIGAGIRACPTMVMISLQTGDMFEPGDYLQTYDTGGGWDLFQGENYSGLQGIRMFMGWSTMCNVWGLTTEQIAYVAAECLIRTGKVTEGLQIVDNVRALRVENPSPFAGTVSTEGQAMALLQRAKWVECIATPFNFFDLRRWNTEAAYQRTVTHDLGYLGQYQLGPQSPLWVQPFPANAVRYNSTLTQNY